MRRQKELIDEINMLRNRLENLIKNEQLSLLSPEVLAASEELDNLINKFNEGLRKNLNNK